MYTDIDLYVQMHSYIYTGRKCIKNVKKIFQINLDFWGFFWSFISSVLSYISTANIILLNMGKVVKKYL